MGRGISTFRQGDVRKAVKAATAAGISISRIEVGKDGKIAIVAGTAEQVQHQPNEWE